MLVKSKIKYIQTLGQKKFRDESAVFIAEGPKLVEELLQNKNTVAREVFALKDWLNADRNLPVTNILTEVTEGELQKLSQLVTPNQVIGVFDKFPERPINAKGKITLALDRIQDPGNLGTIIRIADWFGVAQIVCDVNTVYCYNPKVVQATMGSIARVQLLYTDLNEWIKQQNDVRIYATLMEGQDIGAMKKITEGIIVIGNEAKGISDDILGLSDIKITIPRKGNGESLNAAVATGIILSHLV